MKRLSGSARVRGLAILVLALAVTVPASGCSVFRSRTGKPGKYTAIQVQNDNWLDVNVYLVRSGNPERLGTVGSLKSATYRVEALRIRGNDIRLLADPIGSTVTFLSPPIVVSAGQTIRFDVKNTLSLSTVSVY